MPFKSKSQQRWMFANKPGMAERWADHTPDIKALPEKVGSLDLILAKMAEMDKRALAAWQRPENAGLVAKSLGMNPAELETAMAKQQLAKATGPAAGPSMLAQERASIQAQNAQIEQMRTAPRVAPKAPTSTTTPHPGAKLRQQGFVSTYEGGRSPGVKATHVAPPNTPSTVQGGPTFEDLWKTDKPSRWGRLKDLWKGLGRTKQMGIGGTALGLGGVGLYNLLSGNEKGASIMKKSAEQIANEVLAKAAADPAAIAAARAKVNAGSAARNQGTMGSVNSALSTHKPAKIPAAFGAPKPPVPGAVR